MHDVLAGPAGEVAGLLVGATVVALVAHAAAYRVAGAWARGTFETALARHTRAPARALFVEVALLMVTPALRVDAAARSALQHGIDLAAIVTVAWLAMLLFSVLEEVLVAHYQTDASDNLLQRQMQTRIRIFRGVGLAMIVTGAAALMLMTFPSVRHLGLSMLASAGLAGIVAGYAAQPALSNLIAGLQIALTEPIRLDDVVIVEGEWGWIEEIATTYVVVRIWDLRRLVVPLTYFTQQPMQNWTRRTADLLGTAFVYVDYTVPVDEVRAELHRILQGTSLWNGQTWGLQVTNATEHTLELRALMSAPDSSTAWDLRCHVREHLVAFLQARYPDALPRSRAQVAMATPIDGSAA